MSIPNALKTTSTRRFLRIEGKMHRVGDNVYIPDIGSIGRIKYITESYAVLHVAHGKLPIRRKPNKLKIHKLDGGGKREGSVWDLPDDSMIVTVTRKTTHTITSSQVQENVPGEGDNGKFTSLIGQMEWMGDTGIDDTPVLHETKGEGESVTAYSLQDGSEISDISTFHNDIVRVLEDIPAVYVRRGEIEGTSDEDIIEKETIKPGSGLKRKNSLKGTKGQRKSARLLRNDDLKEYKN